MKIKPLILSIFLMLLVSSSALAFEQKVQLLVNELKVFPVNKIRRVAVGDPGIADITVLSKKEIMIVAKEAGATSLIIWDEDGQHSYNLVVVEKDLEKIAQRIRVLLVSSDIHGIRVKVEEDNIYVMGEVASERQLNKIKDITSPFENVQNLVGVKQRQPLVEVDVNVLEVAYDDLKRLGMDWSNSQPIQYNEPSGHDIDGKMPKAWKVLRWSRTTIDARLNLLIEEDKARTLANPKLVTLSGKEASFLVGGEVPYVTVETDGRTQVNWKEYGINLKILPSVNPQNEITTKLKAEVTDLDWANAVTQEGFNIPALKKREAQTELSLYDGDTIFLAGLIKNEDSSNIDRIPWLSKVPILGELFKSKEFRDKRTELIISVTPTIVGERANAEYVTREMRKEEAILEAQKLFPAFSEEASPLASYTHMIEDIITRNATYPLEAKEAQAEGIVELNLTLSSDGQLKEAGIKKSSGFSVLDQAAVVAVKEQAPYPSFPSQIKQKQLHLTVPVVFKSFANNE